VVVPDHKLYFIPVDTQEEAAYLTGFLNAPTITKSVSAYAAQLSLGASVAEYLDMPKFDPKNVDHAKLSQIAIAITARNGNSTDKEISELDHIVHRMLGI
jgi:hypothetical protein